MVSINKIKAEQKKGVIIVLGTLKSLGGAERQAIYLAQGLSQKGYSVKILSFGEGILEKKLKEEGIDYLIFKFNFLAPFKRKIIPLVKLTSLLRSLKPFALIPFITINSKYIGLIWKFTGAQFACWNQRDEGREVFGTKLEKYSINNLPLVVSNSHEGRDVLMERLKIKPEKVKIINNGIYIPAKTESNYWRAKLKLSTNTSIVSMIASIYKYKDHTTLLYAWAKVSDELQKKGTTAVLLLAGKDKGMMDNLKILAFDLRVAHSIYFLGSIDNTNELIAESEIIVHSSNTEGCPNAVLEAMALKKAVIGTNIPGNMQALGDKYADICLSTPNDPDDLANKITQLLTNKNLNQEIAAYNHERIKKEFSIEQMIDSYHNLVEAYTN